MLDTLYKEFLWQYVVKSTTLVKGRFLDKSFKLVLVGSCEWFLYHAYDVI
jgi:hypothetical protein